MKRTLSILLTIAMIISLIPAVFAADVPTMSTTVDKTEVQPGDTITLTLSIDKTITNLNNWEWAIYFDKDAYVKTSGELEPGCTTSIGSTAGMVGDNVDILGKNAVRVSALSPSGDPVTLNAGKIATVTFTATENITAENARIEVKTEALPDYDTLKDNDVKLTGNIIDVTVKSSEAKGYTVSLSDDFTRTDAEGSVIAAGGTLTFVPKDPNYDYTVTVTVGGVEVPPVIGEDGTYTVSNVNGNVVVTSTKTPKTFTVAQGENTTGAATATYMEDYTFKLTPVEGYTYNMTVTIGGKDYTGFKAQGNDDGTTTYTIPGADVTGDIVINSNKQVKQPETFTVTFDGTGAGEANGESSVKENTNYTFTVAKQENFEYTITATMGGKAVTVTEGANNTYTIANVTGNLVITIEKKSTLTMEVTVSKYVEMDNKTVFLVTVTGTPEEGKAFAYGDNVMYKTTAYGQNVYSWLVIVDKNETFDQATAEAKITQASATAEEVTQSYDVNETGLVDINDAQLTYDIYSGKYTDFEKVSVRKFLRADVTKDKVVNSTDAVAIIANSK